jgi:hypothetical protein
MLVLHCRLLFLLLNTFLRVTIVFGYGFKHLFLASRSAAPAEIRYVVPIIFGHANLCCAEVLPTLAVAWILGSLLISTATGNLLHRITSRESSPLFLTTLSDFLQCQEGLAVFTSRFNKSLCFFVLSCIPVSV